jgi:single-strand DNA-binding protein
MEGSAVTFSLSRQYLTPTHMRSVNKVILVGHVAELPESTEANGGARVCFTIATYREYTSEGKKREVTDYFRIVAWGKLGEICAKYLGKGQGVYVEGTLLQDAYEKRGKREYLVEVRADEVTLLTWKKRSGIERVSLDSIQAD